MVPNWNLVVFDLGTNWRGLRKNADCQQTGEKSK